MKAFVTGSTGLLGNNLVKQLVEAGYMVKALARSKEKAKQLLNCEDVEIVLGDMTRIEEFSAALKECDVLFHAAAYFREYTRPGNHAESLRQINVEGTIQLIEAARMQGVHKVIYVSSIGATTIPDDSSAANEAAAYDNATDNLYFKSKIDSEKAIDQYLKEHPDMHIVLIRPAMMMGPGDAAPTQAGQVILNFLKKKIPVILPGKMTVVDARDVANAMIKAMDKGASGERFIIAGRLYSIKHVMETLEQVSGIPAPRRQPPYVLARIMIGFMEAFSRLTAKEIEIHGRDLKRMRNLRAYDSSKAQQKLGIAFCSLETTIGDSVRWFREHGYSRKLK